MRAPVCIAVAALLAAGCSTFRSKQEHAFVDDDGNILIANYGEMSKPYSYEIVSPVNGHSLTCTDKKAVRVRLPDPNGSWISCYICQNDFRQGTMYATRNGKWKYLTNGLMCRLYLRNATKDDYFCVFEGKFDTDASGPKGGGL